MSIPNSCGSCKYGRTHDMSIDDLYTTCYILGYGEDWCSFPNRGDGTLRMDSCPLPDITSQQIKVAQERIKEYKFRQGLWNKIRFGKTKLIKKRNLARAKKLK